MRARASSTKPRLVKSPQSKRMSACSATAAKSGCRLGGLSLVTWMSASAARRTLPFLVGSAYELEPHTGVVRHTKDLDIFVRRRQCAAVLKQFSAAGYHTELTHPHWLAKAYRGDRFIDIIFSSGNGLAVVDDSWF